MDPARSPSVTRLLHDWRGGDAAALDRLLPLVYQELRSLAHGYLHQERSDHTLQPTALVHEAFLRLVDADIPWQDKAHFMAIAARTMRRILVDHARAKNRDKRGGDWVRQTLDEDLVQAAPASLDVIDLDEALDRLGLEDARSARAAELHYFGGLSYKQTAEVLNISEATAHRDLRFAKAWLMRELGGGK